MDDLNDLPKLSEHEENLLEVLGQGNPVVSVIHGHLFLEITLGKILAVRFPGAERWLEFVQFSDKVKLARREGLIDRGIARVLAVAGSIRNSFAHPPVKSEVSEQDWRDFIKAFPPHLVKGVAEARYDRDRDVAVAYRLGISALHGLLIVCHEKAVKNQAMMEHEPRR